MWKLPLDLWVLQEIVTETNPDLIVETGTNYGGSALYFASLLELTGGGSVITIDRDISRVDERVLSDARITVVEGSSTSPEVASIVREEAQNRRTMVDLDSAHGVDHVGEELSLYGPIVSPGCYLVVEDTIVDTHPLFPHHRSGPGMAIEAWLPDHPEFEVDPAREKYMASFQPGGYLRRLPA